MLTGFEAILPLFFVIACGYLASRWFLDSGMLPAINQFVYYFAVPALLFRAARGMSLDGILYWPGIFGFLGGILLTLPCLLLLNRWLALGLRGERLIIAGMNSTFANYAYMGIPLTFTVLGEQVGPVTVMIILLGNLFIIGGTQVAIEANRQRGVVWRSLWVILNNSLLRNPIFISTTSGLLFSLGDVSLPGALNTGIHLLADAAIPVALFCLGAGLKFRSLASGGAVLPSLLVLKLVLQPLLTWLSLWLFAAENVLWIAATVLLSALPTGALAHVVALKYNVDHEQTSQTIVLSTLLSLLTVSLWVAVILP